jgi:hypothetical protein
MMVAGGDTGHGRMRLVMTVGERMETAVRAACVMKEMVKLMGGDKGSEKVEGGDDVGCGKRTNCEKNSMSVEGEFVFSQAVGEFLR